MDAPVDVDEVVVVYAETKMIKKTVEVIFEVKTEEEIKMMSR